MAKLAFFGTPHFALPSLLAVHRFCKDFGHELSVVVSQKDQPQGRGQQVLPPPVKELALKLGVPVLQPLTLKKGTDEGEQFFEQFKALDISLAVVVAYGKLISERLLKTPHAGFVNVHGSLLPRFRGAAPIQRAIEAGDKETGVCLMDMVKKLDEGDVYVCKKTPILPFDTAFSLFRRLSYLGAHVLYENLGQLLEGSLEKTPQGDAGITYAAMVEKAEGLIDFNQPARLISHRQRAFDPNPGSFGFIRKKRVKFFDSFFIEDKNIKSHLSPGTIVVVGNFLGVKTLDGIVYFERIQVEGKAALPIKKAILGFPLLVGDKIEMAV